MSQSSDPRHLSHALSRLITLRGIGKVRASTQLVEIWTAVAGERIAAHTKVIGLSRGVLNVAVSNAPLLSEIVAFHKPSLLRTLQEKYSEIQIRDVKFRLRGDLSD